MLTVQPESDLVAECPALATSPAGCDLHRARIAVVHDFLHMMAGSEQALGAILEIFPHADVFAQFDHLPADQRGFLKGKKVGTTFLQNMPGVRRHYRRYLPLMARAVEGHDLSSYDVVISNACVAAKGVRTRPDQLHVCYCHTPARFAWDAGHLAAAGIRGLRALPARMVVERFRLWDFRAAQRVHQFVANSRFIAQRIRQAYGREAATVYPPVNVDAFPLKRRQEDFYVTVSRLVPYKRVDLIVDAFSRHPDRMLVVIGDGPELAKLRRRASANVTLMGYQPQPVLVDHLQRARGFVFAAEEDFGIAPVEAQACGTPVIAYGRGGALETVVADETGLFFSEQTEESLLGALREFEGREWVPEKIRAKAMRFRPEIFHARFREQVEAAWEAFEERRAGVRTASDARVVV